MTLDIPVVVQDRHNKWWAKPVNGIPAIPSWYTHFPNSAYMYACFQREGSSSIIII